MTRADFLQQFRLLEQRVIEAAVRVENLDVRNAWASQLIHTDTTLKRRNRLPSFIEIEGLIIVQDELGVGDVAVRYVACDGITPHATATVKIYSGPTLVDTETTDANGYCRFTGLSPGTYYIRYTVPGEGDLSGNTFTLGVSDSAYVVGQIDFDAYPDWCAGDSGPSDTITISDDGPYVYRPATEGWAVWWYEFDDPLAGDMRDQWTAGEYTTNRVAVTYLDAYGKTTYQPNPGMYVYAIMFSSDDPETMPEYPDFDTDYDNGEWLDGLGISACAQGNDGEGGGGWVNSLLSAPGGHTYAYSLDPDEVVS